MRARADGEGGQKRAQTCSVSWHRASALSPLPPTPPFAPRHLLAVGDTLLLGPGADSHRVEEIALLNTVLVRWDGARIWSPNTQLSTAQLVNLSRSANKGESLKVGRRAGRACGRDG